MKIKFISIILLSFITMPLFSLTQIKAEKDKMGLIQPILKESGFSLIESTILGYLFLKIDLTNALDLASATSYFVKEVKINKTSEFNNTLTAIKMTNYSSMKNYELIIKVLYGLIQESSSQNYKEEALSQILDEYCLILFGIDYKDSIKKILLTNTKTFKAANFRYLVMRSLQDTQDDLYSMRSRTDILTPILNTSKEKLVVFIQDQQKELDSLKTSYYNIFNISVPKPEEEKEEES